MERRFASFAEFYPFYLCEPARHNRPATFRPSLYNVAGDWVMYRDILTGRIPL